MNEKRLRTIVYIDGFNFYYGLLKGTPYKWLDLQVLFRRVLSERNHVVAIKYFTARVQPSPANPRVHTRQDTYLKALAVHCPKVEIMFGHFLRHQIRMENADPPPNTVSVWKNEEKGSDVNLALPGAPVRKTSTQLKQYADFVRPIRLAALQESQLPSPVPGTRITKPASW